jgi:hypothetical protein
MIEVEIPKEIKAYKERFILNMTLRQTLSFVIGVLVILPVYLAGVFKYNIDSDLMGWVVLFTGIPIFAVGFFTYRNMTMERFIFQIVKTYFVFPMKRKYAKTETEEFINGSKTKKHKNKSEKK